MKQAFRCFRSVHCAGFCLVTLFFLGLSFGAAGADEPALRTWTDSTGKFKIKAKFVSESGGKVTLEKDDGTEMEIDLKKLSTADQKYVKDLGDSDNPFKPSAKDNDPFRKKSAGSPSKGSKSEAPAGGSEPDVLQAAWGAARQIEVTPKSSDWNVGLPQVPETPKLASKAIMLPPKASFFEKLSDVVTNPEGTKAILTYVQGDPKPEGQTRLVLCDLEKGRVIGNGATTGQWSVLDVNSDGTKVFVRKEAFGWGNQDAVEVWELTSSGIERAVRWLPYDDAKGGDRDIKWGAFLDDERVITSSGKGKVAVWTYADATPQYWLQIHGGGSPTLSPDRKLFVFSTGKDIGVLDLASETVVASFPTDPVNFPILTFSPNGRRLACASFDRVYVWDFEKGKLYREISCTRMHVGSHVLWTDDYNILVGDAFKYLLDLGLQIPIWDYHGVDGIVRAGEFCWLVVYDIHTKANALVPAKLPHPAVKDAINKALMDPDFFVLKSGTTVRIDVSGIPDAGQRSRIVDSLTKKLSAIGCRVGPVGSIDLVASTEQGESKEVRYMFHGTYNFQHFYSKLKFVYQGKPAWESSGSNVPGIVFVKGDETLGSVLKTHEKPNYGWFDNVELPKLLTKPRDEKDNARGIGSSRVTPTGFK
jgi:hypothetical protein